MSYNNERIADIKAAGQLSDDEVEAEEAPCCGCDAPEQEEPKQDGDEPQE